MKIKDLVSKKSIKLNLEETEKEKHISEMVKIFVDVGKVKEEDADKIIENILERERMGSTGIGGGIAIPHIKTDYVDKATGVLGISKKGVEFDALDGEKVYVSFMLLTPTAAANEHLKALAEISAFLKDDLTIKSLKELDSEKEAYKLIKKV